MLRLHTITTANGNPVGCRSYLYSVKNIFSFVVDKSWFDDPLVEKMVMDLDKCEHIRGSAFESPMFGPISTNELSRGVQALILVYKCFTIPRVFNSAIWGDNCCGWLRKLSFKVNYGIYFNHSLAWEINKKIMAQRWDAPNWESCDFHNTDEVSDYYFSTFSRDGKEVPQGAVIGDPEKRMVYVGDATW